MLFALDSFFVQIFVKISVNVAYYFYYGVVISPLHEIFRHTGIFLAGTAKEYHTEIFFLAPCPCSCRTIVHTDSAADALVRVTLDLTVNDLQCANRTFFAVFDTLLTADAASRIILGLCLPYDPKVIETRMCAVV